MNIRPARSTLTTLGQIVDFATRFPLLSARMDTAAAGYVAAPEDSFEFGLRAVLDGPAARPADVWAG